MKVAYYFTMVVSFLLLGVFGLRMFGVFKDIIVTDKAWLMFLFTGIFFAFIWMRIEALLQPVLSRAQARQRKSMIRSSWYGLGLSLLMLGFILFGL